MRSQHRSQQGSQQSLRFVSAIIALLVGLAGCASTSAPEPEIVETPDPLVEVITLVSFDGSEHILASFDVPSVSQLIRLNAEQQQSFLGYFNDPIHADLEPHKRLERYIQDLYFDFSYLGDTFDAQTTMQQKSGNCMSLALLTGAFADLAGLDVRYQRVNAEPIYRRYDNVMTLSSHVRTHLLAPFEESDDIFVIRPARIIVDYYPRRRDAKGDMIDITQFYSMYYQNLAANAMIEKDFEHAYALIHAALEIAPTDQENINTMAVVMTEMGLVEKALSLYEWASQGEINSLNMLSNYIDLLTREGHTLKAQTLRGQMANAVDDNPYKWLDLAEERIQSGKYQIAQRFLSKAIDNAPYLHEAFFYLAKTFYLQNQIEEAEIALQRASELANLPETQRLYNAKRLMLSEHR
jgi:Tfp pilus assembly protein PilF